MEKYIKFMIENAEIIPEELFLELLNLPINSDNPPIVPNHNLIK